MAINDEDIGRIKQAVETIEDGTARITDAIYGNGAGGLLERTVRVEEHARQLLENAVETATFRENTTLTLGEIKTIVTAHHNDKSLHTFQGLVLHKDVLAVVLFCFVGIYALIPAGISAFELLRKLVGI